MTCCNCLGGVCVLMKHTSASVAHRDQPTMCVFAHLCTCVCVCICVRAILACDLGAHVVTLAMLAYICLGIFGIMLCY